MRKMQMAQASIKPAKLRSATAELPLESRKRLALEMAAGDETEPCAAELAAAGAGSELASEMVSGFLMRISDTGAVTSLRLKRQCE